MRLTPYWQHLVAALVLALAAQSSFGAIAFRAATSANSASGTATTITAAAGAYMEDTGTCDDVTPAIPAGSVGDLLIAQVVVRDDATTVTMAGWQLLFSDDTGLDYKVYLFWRQATGTAANEAPRTVAQSGTCDHLMSRITRFGNVDTTQPLETQPLPAGNWVYSNANNVDSGTQTTSVANSMLVLATFAADNGTVAEDASFTQLYENADSSNRDAAISLNTQNVPATGSYGAFLDMALSSGIDPNHGVLFAVRPSAGVGNPALTINRPGGGTTTGDVLVATLAVTLSTVTITPPSGWTEILNSAQTQGGTERLVTYWRAITDIGSEPASYTWTFSGSHAGAVGGISAFSGVDTSSPIVDSGAQFQNGNNATTHTAPSVTASTGDMLVTAHSYTSSGSWTPPGTMTEAVDIFSAASAGGGGVSLEMNYELRAVTGATGTRDAVASGNGDEGVSHALALKAVAMTCFTDDFNRADGVPAGNWVVANEGGSFGNPRIVSNRLRLTDASNAVSTMAALQQLFPAAGNKIIVEFDHFAYNGNGADGIGVVLSDASVAPVPGAFGGSLGYAPKQASAGGDTTHPGFAGGWIGLAIDEYGNYSANTEGRSGGSAPGRTIDSVAVRGSGSDYTGYPYHRGTATLSPGIDVAGATPSPGYRYRITIDHTSGVEAWTSVERDTGGGYVSLIPAYDAKAEAGQAAVPTNWYLSFTGSTGGATNVHEIDNLQVCSTNPQPVPTLDHIRILHNGAALTCAAETVTLKACADASCSTLDLGSVTADLAGIAGAAWSDDPVTFTGGQTSISLAKTTAGTATLGAVAVPSVNATRCFNGATETCSLVFEDTGFIIASVADGAEAIIPGQVAGVSDATYYLRAVKTNTTTKACESALTGATTVNFAYECNDPSACYAADLMNVNGGSATTIARNDNGSVSSYTSVNMTFDANGNAPFTFTYSDVGQIKLYASKSAGGSLISTLIGSSNAFVVKPYDFGVIPCNALVGGICDTAPADPGIAGGGSVFAKAGAAFNVTVTARAFGGTPTYSFGSGSNSGTETVDLTRTRVAPTGVGAVDGALSGTTAIPRSSFSNGVATVSDLTWSEVGVITLTATNNTFLGNALTTTGVTGNIGRFYPDHFDTAVILAASVPMPCPTGLTCPASNDLQDGFVYSGQPFSMQVTAKNMAGGTTQNYDGTLGYAKAVPLTAWDALGSTTTQNPSGSLTNDAIVAATFGAGVATTSVPVYTLTTATTAPTDIYLRATESAGDGVTSLRATPSNSVEGGVKVASGRVKIGNAHGSELLPLPMTVKVEYYNGSYWTTGTTDSVTSLTLADGNYQRKTGGVWTVMPPSGAVAAGVLNFTLSSGGGTGSVDISATAPSWLQFLNPGRATFGVYKGNNEFIYLRENY